MSVLLGNLPDNAIRQPPQRGRVDVICGDRRILSDSTSSITGLASGIRRSSGSSTGSIATGGARGEGSGLGLAIVSRIAKRHRIKLCLRKKRRLTRLASLHFRPPHLRDRQQRITLPDRNLYAQALPV
jgi:signal transduction histidine kinase